MTTPSNANARMTPTDASEPTPDGFCVCNGPAANGRMRDCGIAAHRAEAGAPEPTPLEAVARVLFLDYEDEHDPGTVTPEEFEPLARASTEALLAGDWMERVLREHDIECTGRGEVTCRGCRERGWMSWPAFRSHQAAAIRATALGGAA